ncbi:tetraspanin-2-like [Camellia sinensis]|uniref:Uncharacterized protein n=1 Tax=Camellia sinensis var. sinensis TaxID=542762 RepID=A0A4S4E9P7_CAMSN|nr:tetraspanin-2-like [Camellia sinensis]THG12858.1 hypothetical protein TEA_028466 [Camellia sinensis var. sinensis]
MAVSNNITSVLNFIAFLSSIPIIASGVWLASKPDNECIHWIRWPLVFLGIFILLVSLTGFVGSYWNKECLLAFYLICMVVLIGALLIILVLAFVVTRPDGSYSVDGRAFREYRLGEFSAWLRNHITNSDNLGKLGLVSLSPIFVLSSIGSISLLTSSSHLTDCFRSSRFRHPPLDFFYFILI